MSTFTYPYTRAQVTGGWDVDHPERINTAGARLLLAEELQSEFPGIGIKVRCAGTALNVVTDTELTGEQQTALDGVVSTHQANTWTAETLVALKIKQITALVIDANIYLQSQRQYDLNRQLSLENRLQHAKANSLPNRATYIESLTNWIFGQVIAHYRSKKADILAAADAPAILAVTWDFDQFTASDPGVSVDGALDIGD